MDAVFTNTKTDGTMVYIPGPDIEIAFGASKTWSGINPGDLDNNARIKEMVDDGDITISVTATAHDNALWDQTGDLGSIDRNSLSGYTVAGLAALTGYEGRLAFATDGRKVGEGGGAGTGVPVYFSNTAWRVFATDAAVAA